MKLPMVLSLIAVLGWLSHADAQDKWKLADQATVRLSPTAFPQLPRRIASYLRSRRCTVPQTFIDQQPHNVIQGHFAKPEQLDWAVLCSRNRVSSILVFWNGSTKAVSSIASAKDEGFLQSIVGKGSIGFSRSIGTVGRRFIMKHYEWYGGPKPPKITHQGIDDAFVEKASSVLYFHAGRWLTLQGAD